MSRTATPSSLTRDAQFAGHRMTYRNFLAQYDDGSHVEWVNGEVVEMPPISSDHDRLEVFLLHLFSEFLEGHAIGELRHDPYNMKTGPDLPGRAPDILFVATKNLKRLKKSHLQGPADLAVEIVSPRSGGVDRGDKYYEYERGGVLEYWLIDPQRKTAEFHQRSKRGRYQLIPVDADGIYRSRMMPGLWVKELWFWYPFPAMATVRREWADSEAD